MLRKGGIYHRLAMPCRLVQIGQLKIRVLHVAWQTASTTTVVYTLLMLLFRSTIVYPRNNLTPRMWPSTSCRLAANQHDVQLSDNQLLLLYDWLCCVRWEQRRDPHGWVYYVDHNMWTTTWLRPSVDLMNNLQQFHQWRQDRQMEQMAHRFPYPQQPAATDDLGPLPEGWGNCLS